MVNKIVVPRYKKRFNPASVIVQSWIITTEKIEPLPNNFLRWALKYSNLKPSQIYHSLGWTRQRFWELLKPGRNLNCKNLKTIRKAFGINEEEFYRLLQEFYERDWTHGIEAADLS